ncbi:MAG: T9SS type A sorting domain-containing protein [Bacteroidetes bacterium]|nr:T9SS type A sorting domain-containing protein [Bacteroidota bacterium]
MKHIISFLVVLFLFQNGYSNGYLGGGLSYEIDDKGKCTFIFSFLRDCKNCRNDSCNPSNLSLTAKNYSNSLTWKLKSETDVTPFKDCYNCSRCSDTACINGYGFNLVVFETSIDLKGLINQGICNIVASLNTNAISSSVSVVSSDKVFHKLEFNACEANTLKPAIRFAELIGLGDDYVKNRFDQSDKDSVFYSLEPVLKSEATNASYASLYDYAKPVKYLGFPKAFDTDKFPFGFNLDSAKGSLMFRPMTLQTSMVRIKRQEYRNGKFLCSASTDLFIGVVKLPENNVPIISGINCASPEPANFKTEVCVGEKICFTICTSDKDTIDKVTIGWNEGISDGTFTIVDTTAKRQAARFCWTPTEADARQNPPVFRFVVNASDNNCFENGFAGRTFTIRVKEKPTATVKTVDEKCGEIRFMAEKTGEIGIGQFLWAVDGKLYPRRGGTHDTLYHKFKRGGYYSPFKLIIVGANGCNNTLTDSIYLNPDLLTRSDTFLTGCVNQELSIDVSKWFIGTPPIFNWIDNGSTNPKRSWQQETDTLVKFYIPGDRCTDTGWVKVDYQQVKADFKMSPGVGDVPLTVKTQNLSEKDARFNHWTFYEGNKQTLLKGWDVDYEYTMVGLHSVRLINYSFDSLCVDSITKVGIVNAFPTSINELKDLGVEVYPNPAADFIQITNKTNEPISGWIIDVNGIEVKSFNLQQGNQSIDISEQARGNYIMHLLLKKQVYSLQITLN